MAKLIATFLAFLCTVLFASCGEINAPDIQEPEEIEEPVEIEEPAEFEPDVIIEYFIINAVYRNTGWVSDYYTVYAWNLETGRTECIADDVGIEDAPEWLITTGQYVIRVYPSDMPYYSGELYPVYGVYDEGL